MSRMYRKVGLLVTAALCIGAFSATTANATPLEVLDSNSGEPCTEVTVTGANVSGGCIVEMQGSWAVADGYTQCSGGFDMHIDSTGAFYTGDPTSSYPMGTCYHGFSETVPSEGQLRDGVGLFYADIYPLALVHYNTKSELALPVTDAEFEQVDWDEWTLEIQGSDAGCPLPPEMQQYCATYFPGMKTYFAGSFDGQGDIEIYELE
jgi:hypothetical protein